jgi:uncharacterized protein (DUF433 family)
MSTVVGAYSEEQVALITGASRRQLQSWARTGFYVPSLAGEGAFSRIYSFRDLVSLKVINTLRNVNGVSMQELRKVAAVLKGYGEDAWTKTRLWVFRRKVLFSEPDTGRLREVAGKQYVAEICIEVEIRDALEDVRRLNVRRADEIGHIDRNRNVNHRAYVIKGTRIPVSAIKSFHGAGYSVAAIQAEYPDLMAKDIQAAIDFDEAHAA